MKDLEKVNMDITEEDFKVMKKQIGKNMYIILWKKLHLNTYKIREKKEI